MSGSRNIYLVGMPGAGKSTLGRKLAKLLVREFVDLDDLIEEQMNMSVSSIFAELGESGFRVAEQRALHSVLNQTDLVVGTGGGTSCFYDNMEQMNRHGVTIFLNPPLDELARRIRLDIKERPKLAGTDSLSDLLARTFESRRKFYALAKFEFTNPEISGEMIMRDLERESDG